MIKKICVIGGGPSGLCAIKRLVESSLKVVAFEKQNGVGGTWNYTDEIGVDKNGVEVHPSMYQNLMTNIPKEIMQFPGFPYPYEDRSFLKNDKILHYINLFADEFNLRKHIRFEHEVVKVRPLRDEKWEVIVRDLKTNNHEISNVDAVMICNGFSSPIIPKIPGSDLFCGKQMHSHDYRKPQTFIGEKVLLIGSGPSGIEMALEVGKYAEKVFWSHHSIREHGKGIIWTLPERVEEKPDFEKLTENRVVFVDGTSEEITMIAYATGYDFTYPFLSVDCGVSVDQKYVRPLYKHIININRPTMAFINLPFIALSMPLFDLQVRFALKYWSNPEIFPVKDEMYEDMINDEESRKARNVPKKKFHFLGPHRHKQYYEKLAAVANIDRIPPVFGKALDTTIKLTLNNYNTFRNYDFKIVDDENLELSLSKMK